tara:strand:- start:395 stop:880 length:486 start_codon:yes stop_codon:yes gene_type:complete
MSEEYPRKPKRPSAWDIIQNRGIENVEPDKRLLPVKERLEDLQNQPPSVKERLERLQSTPQPIVKPIDDSFLPDKPTRPAIITPESNMQKKIEKVLAKLTTIRTKMTDSENYLSHYYDLQKEEKELIKLIEDSKMELLEFPVDFQERLEKELNKLRTTHLK